MYRHKTTSSIALCILFISIVLAVSRHGENNRIFASVKTAYTVNSPQNAYLIWKEKSVKGRTLILFDTYPHTIGLSAYKGFLQLNKTNLIEFSILNNIIRRIYFIVPEMEWTEFRSQKFVRLIREATNVTKGVYLYNQSGIPFIAVTPSSLPQIEEEVLVYINNEVFDAGQALTLLSEKKISSDIIIQYESLSK